MKKIILILVLFVGVFTVAQEKLNNYKYVVIPSQFDFQKSENQYNLNRLLKMKFQQLGFDAYLDTDELPREVKTNTCSYLKPVLLSKSNLFKTTVILQVLDCDKNILFKTQEGLSRSKSYKIGYNEALRMALKSFGNYRLSFKKTDKAVVGVDASKAEKSLSTPQIYKFNNKEVKIIKYGFATKEIREVASDKLIGKLIASSLKPNIYHFNIEGNKGLCYFLDNGNLVLETLEDDNTTITMQVIKPL